MITFKSLKIKNHPLQSVSPMPVVLKLVGGTGSCKFYAGIHRTLC